MPKGVVLTLSRWHHDLLPAIQLLTPGAILALSAVCVAAMKGHASIDFSEVLTTICNALPADGTLIVEKEMRVGCRSRVSPDATALRNTSSRRAFFSSPPTRKRSACEPMPVSAISDSLPPISSFPSNSSSHSDNRESGSGNFTPCGTSDNESGNESDGWIDNIPTEASQIFLSEEESLKAAKALSLATIKSSHTSALWQQIGPRQLPTRGTLVDVSDDGDCF
jgi:hypothetical protein